MDIRKTPRGRPRLFRSLPQEDESKIINSAVDKILLRNSIANNVKMAAQDQPLEQNSSSKEIFDQWSPKENEAKKSFLDDEISDFFYSGKSTPKKREKKLIPRKNLGSWSPGLGLSKASQGGMKLARRNNREVKLSKRNGQITTIGEKMANVNEIELVDEAEACDYKCVKMTPKGFPKNINVISRNIKAISDATPSDQIEIEVHENADEDKNMAKKIDKTDNIQKGASIKSNTDIKKLPYQNTDIKKKLPTQHKVEKLSVKQEMFKSRMKSGKILAGKSKTTKSLQISPDGWQRCGVEQCDKFRYVVDDNHGDWMCSKHSGGVATHPSVFKVGSVVTAGFRGKAAWPGMVDFCPDTEMWAWPKSEKMKGTEENYLGWFNVTFFSNPVSRAWIPAARVHLYDHSQGVKISRSATSKDSNSNKNIKIGENKNTEKEIGKNKNDTAGMATAATRSKASMETVSKASKTAPSKKMQVALEMVGRAMKLNRKERVASFSFINNYKGAWKVDQK